jgi:hypothetical protein
MSRQTQSIESRLKQNREKSPVKEQETILISWKHYRGKDGKIGQLISEWDENLLKKFFNKVDIIQELNYSQARDQRLIKFYTCFPKKEKTDFKCPDDLDPTSNWGTIQGFYQHARVAGFFDKRYFYIVFLDKDHKFYKSSEHHKETGN